MSSKQQSIATKQPNRIREDSRRSMPSTQLMTPQECAAFLQVKVNTLYVMNSQGRIPSRKVGHLLRFDVNEIIQWTKGPKKSICDAATSHVPSAYLCGCNRRTEVCNGC
jgi:excisionase family DNA binding protein